VTLEDVNRLKAEAEAAQAEADTARAEAVANPTDSVRGGAAVDAAVKASETWKAWSQAERTVPAVSAGDWRAVLIGMYLIAMLLVGVYVLTTLAMAVPPEKATGELFTRCCGLNGKDCLAPSPTATPEANTNTATNSTGSTRNSTTANSNQSNSNAKTNSSAIANVADQANNSTPQTTPTLANSVANKTPTATPPVRNADAPEILIPAIVCVNWFGRITADGYLFLTVLFAGLVGAATRLVFSFVRHHGKGDFSLSWAWFYIFTPFSGATVSLFLYFVIRGGFYGSPIGKSLALNVFAFIALGTLSGLFAENAMEKLRQVAAVLLAPVSEKVENPQKPAEK
jgi:hypothetical protein